MSIYHRHDTKRSQKHKAEDWKEILINADLAKDNFQYEVVCITESSHLCWPILRSMKEASKISYQYNIITYDDILNEDMLYDFTGISDASVIYKILNMCSPELGEILERSTSKSVEVIALLIKLNIMIIRERYLQRKIDRKIAKDTIAQEIAKIKGQFTKKHDDGKSEKGKKDKGKKDKGKKDKGKKEKLDKKSKESTKEKDKKHKKQSAHHHGDESQKQDDILFNRECITEEPNLPIYFILMSFYEDALLEALQKLGVDVNLFIEFGSDVHCADYEQFGENEEIRLWKMNKFWHYWKENHYILPRLLPENTGFIKYMPAFEQSYLEKRVYKDIKAILGNVEHIKRQHKVYLKRLKLMDIEEKSPLVNLEDLVIYKKRLESIPNECVTIPLLLHFLLEEVEAKFSENYISSDENLPAKEVSKREKRFCKNTKEKILKEFSCRSLTQEVKKEKKLAPKSVYFSYGNTVDYLLNSAPKPKTLKFNLVNTLKWSKPLEEFSNFKELSDTENSLNKEVLENWRTTLPDLTEEELEKSMYAFLFDTVNFLPHCPQNRNLPSNSEDKIRELIYGEDCSEKNCPKIYLKPKFLLPEISSKLSSKNSELSHASSSSCSVVPKETDCVEMFDAPTMVQVIYEAYKQFQSYHYKYVKLFDSILLKFTDDCDAFGVSKQKFATSLYTTTPFRDFCAYIFANNLDYFKKEREQYYKTHAKKGKLSLVTVYEQKIFKKEDFIIPGSFKDEALQAEKQKLESSKKHENKKDKKDGKKGKGKDKKKDKKSDDKSMKTKSTKSKEGNAKEKKSKSVKLEKKDEILEKKDKQFVFDFYGYDIDAKYLNLKTQLTKFQTNDNILVTLKKTQFPLDTLCYTFNILLHENCFVLQCRLEENLVPDHRFSFRLNLSNNIIIYFEKQATLDSTSSLSYIFSNIEDASRRDSKVSLETMPSKVEEKKVDSSTKILSKNEKEILEALRSSLQKDVLPKLKIISSPLHKYQYVKRTKSSVYLPVESIIRRVFCKADLKETEKGLLLNTAEKKKSLKEVLISKPKQSKNLLTEKTNHFDWRISFPTGLTIQAVPILDPEQFYIKQKYVISRSDLGILKEEKYRCILPNGVLMKFMIDDSIITYHYNRSINTYKYGYFEQEFGPGNPQKTKPVRRTLSTISSCKRNQHSFERKIKKLCNRYKKHDSGISDSMRLQSRHFENKDLRKVYQLSKRLYNDKRYMYPLINTKQIASDGSRFTIRNSVVCEEKQKFKEILHTDYLANETTVFREDGVVWFLDANGRATTEFNDGTRITTWPTIVSEEVVIEIEICAYEYYSFLGESSHRNTSEFGTWCGEEMYEEKLSSSLRGCAYAQSKMEGEFKVDRGNKLLAFSNEADRRTARKAAVADEECEVIRFRSVAESRLSSSSSKIGSLVSSSCKAGNESPGTNSIETPSTKMIKTSPWVLVELNYLFEHPNYAPVSFSENCALIQLPDQVTMCIEKGGTYQINTPEKDHIEITKKNINFATKLCENCSTSGYCNLNISPFILGEETDEIFLYARDSSNRVFTVDFKGKANSEIDELNQRRCDDHQDGSTERLFVLHRNLDGCEYFRGTPKSRFAHCLGDFDDSRNFLSVESATEENCTKIIKTLKSTYSNHFIMPYKKSSLIPKNAGICNDKIWKFENGSSQKYHVPENVLLHIYRNFYQIKNFQRDILDQGLCACFLPPKALSSSENTAEEVVEDVEIPECTEGEEEKTPAKRIPVQSVESLMRFYKNIIDSKEMPRYFEILKGQMFCLVSSCVENAMKSSDIDAILNEIVSAAMSNET